MSDTDLSKLRRMVLRGADYREDYELEYFGETMTLKLRPLNDPEFIDLMDRMDDAMDDDEFEEQVDELDELEDDELPDEAEFDTEFVEVMRDAAKTGVDHEAAGETQEGINELVDMMVGGVSIDIGAEVMEITSDLQEAERFREGGAGR